MSLQATLDVSHRLVLEHIDGCEFDIAHHVLLDVDELAQDISQ